MECVAFFGWGHVPRSLHSQKSPCLRHRKIFPNLLNVKNVPEQSVDGDLNLFSDLGAWSGYALPVNQSRAFAGAFIGPMTMHGRGWIAQTLAQPTLVVNGEKYDLVRNMQTAKYLPGKLIQHFKDAQLEFTTELCFATSRTAFVRSVITNLSDTPLNVSLTWSGGVFEENTIALRWIRASGSIVRSTVAVGEPIARLSHCVTNRR